MLPASHIKEINLEFQEDEQIITLPLLSVVTKKRVKPETLLYNLNRTINTNSTSNLDYAMGGANNHPLEPLSYIFCDNVIIYSTVPNCDLSKHQSIIEKLKSQELQDKSDKEDKQEQEGCGNELFKPFLATMTETIVKALNAISLQVNKTQIKPTQGELGSKYGKEVGIQFIKVALPDIPLSQALDLVCNPLTNQYLLDCGIMIANVDFAQDYKGVFNKKEVIEHLISNRDFRMRNTKQERENGNRSESIGNWVK
jgi:hypothetical protein